MKLDELLLEEFIHTFFGYGDYQAEYWFVGMGESGGNSFNEYFIAAGKLFIRD